MNPILTFESVALAVTPAYEFPVHGISFQLGAGEVLLVELDEAHGCPPLVDVAMGLLPPESGQVLFETVAWENRRADDLAQARSRIGRVFEDREWVSNLDLDENITLAQRHHSRRPVHDIMAEAADLGKRLGWSSLPAQRPAWASRHDRMVGQWVRALLGSPKVILLERPVHDVDAAAVAAFIQAVEEKRQQGMAVVWMSSDPRLLHDKRVTASQRARILEGRWEWVQ